MDAAILSMRKNKNKKEAILKVYLNTKGHKKAQSTL